MVEFPDVDAEIGFKNVGHGQTGVLVELFSDSLASGFGQLRALSQGQRVVRQGKLFYFGKERLKRRRCVGSRLR